MFVIVYRYAAPLNKSDLLIAVCLQEQNLVNYSSVKGTKLVSVKGLNPDSYLSVKGTELWYLSNEQLGQLFIHQRDKTRAIIYQSKGQNTGDYLSIKGTKLWQLFIYQLKGLN